MAATPWPAPPPASPDPSHSIDSPDMRQAGRERLSLALIDARNHTLRLLSFCQEALGSPALALAPPGEIAEPPLWLAGHVGWFSEWWIGRNTQRALGMACPARPMRLGSIEPGADAWWDPDRTVPAQRASAELPDLDATRAYLLETLESTLETLEKAAETDDGLYFYRLALFHEDLRGEQLVVTAQTLCLAPPAASSPDVAGLLALPVAPAAREPLWVPATAWTLGWPGPGFAFAQELGVQAIDVPAFEIDAQPVAWSQFIEFVDDGGYDREALWRPEGWRWLARQDASARRAPRHVEQIGGAGGAVLQNRFGRLVRVAGQQAAVHLGWWEADAWARWAGRRLATEVEWEIAATLAVRRGFRWGEVHEWTAGTLRAWPGFRPDPWSAGTAFDPQPAFGRARVLRGASFA
ncbi:MAG: hypothetical protein JWQ03_813, partial [Variovorax sp.]|nr:hypothetical protein [Variovorax sp.]